jgi:hypothetical protein
MILEGAAKWKPAYHRLMMQAQKLAGASPISQEPVVTDLGFQEVLLRLEIPR